MKLSLKIYIVLLVVLAVLAGITVFLPQGEFMILPEEDLPASKAVLALVNAGTVLVVYGILGYIGLKLSRKLGFADIWDKKVTNRQRFLMPAAVGILIGVFFVVADSIFVNFHELGPLPHPPFPTSLVASVTAGIGEEIVFRLFFVSFWVWLVSYVILNKKWQGQVFWVVAAASGLVFAFGHVPAVMLLYEFKSISDIPSALMSEIILLNGVLSIFAAFYFRKFGFLAAVGIHFWADVVWHVVWGF